MRVVISSNSESLMTTYHVYFYKNKYLINLLRNLY